MLDKSTAALYTSLSKLKPPDLQHLINHVDEGCINKICEGVYNIIHTDLGLSKKKKNNLRKQLKNSKTLKNLKLLTKKKTNISRKRKALIQEGQGVHSILSALAPIVLPVLVSKNKK